MSIIALVPARGGSKSIPLKNIKTFCGKPLINWILEELDQVEKLDQVYVATDSELIENEVEKLNGKKN